MANDPSVRVAPEDVEKAKKWALIRFREMLRGVKLTENVNRFLSGELDTYRFQVEIALDERTKEFIEDPRNTAALEQERLV